MHDITVNKQTNTAVSRYLQGTGSRSPPDFPGRDALDPHLKRHGKGSPLHLWIWRELTAYEDLVFYWMILAVKLPLKWLAVGIYSCWVILSSHSLRFIAVFLNAPLIWFPSFVFKKLFTYHCWNISHGICRINVFSQSSTELLKLTMWKFMLL